MFGLYLNQSEQLVGLLIIYVENHHAHIGYLFAKSHNEWHVINGGVSKDNRASAHVLTKQGFVETPSNSSDMLHFELTL